MAVFREPADDAVLQASASTRPPRSTTCTAERRTTSRLGGPSRTRNIHGIANSDWFVTQGGDGFQTPDRSAGPEHRLRAKRSTACSRGSTGGPAKASYIQPQSAPGEPPLRWNWDSPLIISPHNHTRLYFAAQRIFRSDDRGNTWQAVSGDLTRQIDRNKLKVMGRVWSVDAVAKNASTSFYGNIVSLAESPLSEGLLVRRNRRRPHSGDRGRRRDLAESERCAGVPDVAYVAALSPSPHDAGTVYAAFDNHKNGGLQAVRREEHGQRPVLDLDRRRPARARHRSAVVIEDPGERDLLFAGTEFGLFFTRDAGTPVDQADRGLPQRRGARPRDPEARERPGGRDVRPRLLHPGRPARRCAGRRRP